MSFSHRWVGFDQTEAVVQARLHSYAAGRHELDDYRKRMHQDRRARDGDFLLLEKGGHTVGTTTSLSMTMLLRGVAVSCQGVAWVGTVRTERRKARAIVGGAKEPGIATRLMRLTIDRARERGEVISALMPFRTSFYEHFGYGLAEQRSDWTIPLSILPEADTSGFRDFTDADLPAVKELRRDVAHAGQCDFERDDVCWALELTEANEGFAVVDYSQPQGATDPSGRTGPSSTGGGRVNGYAVFDGTIEDGQRTVTAHEWFCRDEAALVRMLSFFGSLKDQYARLKITCPGDMLVHRMLKETQLPHRNVSHATASVKPYTRMQVRILDHARFISAVPLPGWVKGKVSITVRECEGTESRFDLEADGGRGNVRPANGAASTFACTDSTWASVVCGDLTATRALRLGLAQGNASAAALLDGYSHGPVPFSREYF